eukprot:990414-Rhodomonas_salina.1
MLVKYGTWRSGHVGRYLGLRSSRSKLCAHMGVSPAAVNGATRDSEAVDPRTTNASLPGVAVRGGLARALLLSFSVSPTEGFRKRSGRSASLAAVDARDSSLSFSSFCCAISLCAIGEGACCTFIPDANSLALQTGSGLGGDSSDSRCVRMLCRSTSDFL